MYSQRSWTRRSQFAETTTVATNVNGDKEKKQKTRRLATLKATPNTKNNNNQQAPMDYSIDQVLGPCIRQVAQLELRPKVPKQPKLLSSKSLSQLVPRALFFTRRSTDNNKCPTKDKTSKDENKLTSTKSFPCAAFHSNAAMQINDEIVKHEFVVNNKFQANVSTIGLPRHSSSRNSITILEDNCTLVQASISPIVGSQLDKQISLCSNQEAIVVGSNNYNNDDATISNQASEEEKTSNDKKKEKSNNKKDNGTEEGKKRNGLKALKNTTLVLRDVKNSLGLRMKAKQESQAFAKLTNEVATPPTKLYSPFNIYTPDNCVKNSKSRQRLNLNSNSNSGSTDADSSMASMDDNGTKRIVRDTPKRRAALQHKLHLMQGSKFNFNSPTGKFEETVKDVEHFQRCIEDISKAIKARGSQS